MAITSTRAPSRQNTLSIVFYAIDIALLIALLLLPIVWLFHRVKIDWHTLHWSVKWGWKPVLVPTFLLLGRYFTAQYARHLGCVLSALFEHLWFKRIILMLVSTYIVVALFEGVLTLLDFKDELPVAIAIVGKNTDGTLNNNETISDPELIYRLKPGSTFAGRHVNAIGFLGREVDPVKAPGATRVICMGDSVTAQGRPCYAQYLHELLTNAPPTTNQWEAFNMGIHAYTSLQGLALFNKQGRFLKPDIVSIFYGWNDHWLSDRADRQQMDLVMKPWAAKTFDALRDKRIFMFLMWMLNPVFHMARLGQSPDPLDYQAKPDVFYGRMFRVPPDEYRDTLLAFVAAIRRAGAIPLVITAPRSSISEDHVYKREMRSVEGGNRLHDQYAEITREVARHTQAPLLDLAAIMANPEDRRYFAADGVHFDLYPQEPDLKSDVKPEQQPGLRRVAAELDHKIREIVHSPEWRKLHAP